MGGSGGGFDFPGQRTRGGGRGTPLDNYLRSGIGVSNNFPQIIRSRQVFLLKYDCAKKQWSMVIQLCGNRKRTWRSTAARRKKMMGWRA